MSRLIIIKILAISLLISNTIMAGNGPGHGQQSQLTSSTSQINVDTSIILTDEEETDLAFMREEEKLARDVYLHFFDLLGTKIFTNISNAEQAHMDSIKVIIDAYDLTDPAPIDHGFFTDPDLQSLYDQLTIAENGTLINALNVGSLIEEVDIRDLYHAISNTSNPALIQVYTQLLNGSYKHLNAFVSQLSSQGVSYSAQLLSEDEVNSILSGEIFNSEITSALAIDSDNNIEQTQSRFSHTISSNSTILGNNIELSADTSVILSSHFIPDTEDVGQDAEFIVILGYKRENKQYSWYTASGEWNGDPQTLTGAGQQTLSTVQNFDIFQGTLSNLQGMFSIYVGYRLNNGKIVFSAEPLSFSVQ